MGSEHKNTFSISLTSFLWAWNLPLRITFPTAKPDKYLDCLTFKIMVLQFSSHFQFSLRRKECQLP